MLVVIKYNYKRLMHRRVKKRAGAVRVATIINIAVLSTCARARRLGAHYPNPQPDMKGC